MKFKIIYNLLTVGIILTATMVQAQKVSSYPQGIEHVIIIGIDGMSPDGIRKAKTPVMHKMIAEGAIKWNVRTVLPSSSSSNWASMIMGAGTEAHGILDNSWEKEDASLPPIVSGESGIFPTIFSVVRKAKPMAEIAAIYQWEGFGRLFEKKALSYDKNFSTEERTSVEFVKYLIDKKPTFAFLHLDDVDGAGHKFGHGTAEYYKAIDQVDSIIGAILKGVKDAGITNNTLVIVTADHGGIGYGHGGATIDEGEIAMIFYGKGVKKGYKIQQQVYTYDLAASIAFALKIVPPYAWTGRPVKSAFTGFSEPENVWLGKEIIPSPIIYPEKHLFAQAGGLYIDEPAMVKMTAVAEESTMRYTLDGTEPGVGSSLYTSPFSLDKTAVVKARSFNKAGNESLTETAYFRILKTDAGNGLNASFYSGKDWNHLPIFADLKASKNWLSNEFALKREQILPLLETDNNTFGIVFEGYIEIITPGDYTFYTQSDDGSKLFLNNQKIVDNNGDHGVVERSGTIHLDKGRHAIRVEYFNAKGGFWLEAFYKGPKLAKQIIPADKLFLNN